MLSARWALRCSDPGFCQFDCSHFFRPAESRISPFTIHVKLNAPCSSRLLTRINPLPCEDRSLIDRSGWPKQRGRAGEGEAGWNHLPPRVVKGQHCADLQTTLCGAAKHLSCENDQVLFRFIGRARASLAVRGRARPRSFGLARDDYASKAQAQLVFGCCARALARLHCPRFPHLQFRRVKSRWLPCPQATHARSTTLDRWRARTRARAELTPSFGTGPPRPA